MCGRPYRAGYLQGIQRLLALIREDDGGFGAHSLLPGWRRRPAENVVSAFPIIQRGDCRSMTRVLRYIRPAQAVCADPLAAVL